MNKKTKWSQEELEYLEDSWGSVSMKGIAKNVNRSIQAVKLKAQRIGLDDARYHYDGITVNQLSMALNTHYGILKNWIKLYNFPAKKKTFASTRRVLVVKYQDFWKWAEQNKHMLDFSRLERLAIGPEPEWVDEKRKADQIKKQHVPKPHSTPWSKNDDARLQWMLDKQKYTYPEIADQLKRGQAAIKRRILDLGLSQKPIPLENHKKYTDQELQQLVDLLDQGHCFEEIAVRLGRGALGVRGKAERMGYKFRNGVPVLDKDIG